MHVETITTILSSQALDLQKDDIYNTITMEMATQKWQLAQSSYKSQ